MPLLLSQRTAVVSKDFSWHMECRLEQLLDQPRGQKIAHNVDIFLYIVVVLCKLFLFYFNFIKFRYCEKKQIECYYRESEC